MNSHTTTVVSVATSNHLPLALALYESVRRHNKGILFHLVLVDRSGEYTFLEKGRPELRIVNPECFEIPRWKRFVFQYDATGLCCALKAWCVSHFLRAGFDNVVYLDADIQVYGTLEPIFELLADHSFLLTPHVADMPLADGKRPTAESIRLAGVFNGGFMAARLGASERFLEWLKLAVAENCIKSMRSGLLYDQTFLPQACGLVEDLGMVIGPGYNVAYWNLHERTLEESSEGVWTVNGEPLKFFHFSGMPLSGALTLSRHQDRIQIAPGSPLEKLVVEYRSAVAKIAAERDYPGTYLYSDMSDGTTIKPSWRECVRLALDPLESLENPFTADRKQQDRLDEAARHDRVVGRLFDPFADTDFDKHYHVVLNELQEYRDRFDRLHRRPVRTALGWLWRRIGRRN